MYFTLLNGNIYIRYIHSFNQIQQIIRLDGPQNYTTSIPSEISLNNFEIYFNKYFSKITILDLKYISRLLSIPVQLFIHLLENNFTCHVNKNTINYEHTVGMYSLNECCKFHVKLSFPFDKCFFELHFAWFLVHCHEQGQTPFVQKKLPHPALQTLNLSSNMYQR